MSIPINTETAAITTTERTYCVERQTPSNGPFMLLVHREVVKTLPDGAVLSRTALPDAVYEPIAKTARRACFAKYMSRLGLKSIEDLIAIESEFYDALVEETRADRAKQAQEDLANQSEPGN